MKAPLIAFAAGLSMMTSLANAAAVHIASSTVIIDVDQRYNDNLTLLSSNQFATQVSMNDTLRRFSTLALTDTSGFSQGASRWYISEFGFAAQDGYEITSVDFTFTFAAQLHAASGSGVNYTPFAENRVTGNLGLRGPNTLVDSYTLLNEEGTLTGTLTAGEVNGTEPFKLYTSIDGIVSARGVRAQTNPDGSVFAPARASVAEMRMLDAVMTVHTRPILAADASITGQALAVPEPQTYAMLLTGFGLVAAALARRRA